MKGIVKEEKDIRFKPIHVLKGHRGWIRGILLIHKKYLVSGSQDRFLRVWDLETYECLKVIRGDKIAVLTIAKLNDENTVVSGGHDKHFRFWKMDRILKEEEKEKYALGDCDSSVLCHTNSVRSLLNLRKKTKEEPNVLCTGSADKTIMLWDIQDGTEKPKLLRTLKGDNKGTVYVLFELTEENILVSGSGGGLDNCIRFWSMENWNLLRVLKGHYDSVRALIKMKGFLISGSWDNTVRIWDIEKGKCLKILKDHEKYVIALLETKDNYLISGSEDCTMRIWDNDFNCVDILSGAHRSYVKCLVELENGNLISGSADKTIIIWEKNIKI